MQVGSVTGPPVKVESKHGPIVRLGHSSRISQFRAKKSHEMKQTHKIDARQTNSFFRIFVLRVQQTEIVKSVMINAQKMLQN